MSLFINVDNRKIDFRLEYRKRKSLSIRIDPTGNILVIAPKGLSQGRIEELLKSKSKWILNKLDEIEEIGYKDVPKEFVDGELFMYLGENYPLEIEVFDGVENPEIVIFQGKIHIKTPRNDTELLKNAMERWYREMCFIMINQRVDYYKEIIGKEPNNIRVKEQKKRWGSCTSRGDILLNWRCIMAPLEIIDYIVVHEMCHLVYMNHSKVFWALVESILPDYKKRRDWLKRYGIFLNIESIIGKN